MPLVTTRRTDEELRDQLMTISGFVRSEQYSLLDKDARKVPGLVFAALAAYVLALQENIMRGEGAAGTLNTIDDILQVFEVMAASGDDLLKNLLVTEVFENWDESRASGVLRRRLGPESDALYRRWIEKTAH